MNQTSMVCSVDVLILFFEAFVLQLLFLSVYVANQYKKGKMTFIAVGEKDTAAHIYPNDRRAGRKKFKREEKTANISRD